VTYPHDDGRSDRRGYNRQDDRGAPRDAAPPRDARNDPRDPRGSEPPRQQKLEPPAGSYPVRAKAHRFGETKKGDPQVGVALEIVDGQYKGKRLTWYGTFVNEQAEEITIKALRALGFRGVDLTDLSSIYEGEAIAVVDHEADLEGVMRVKVKWINGADVMMKKELAGADLKRFADRMRGKLARTATPDTRPPTGATRRDEREYPPAPRDEQRQWARDQTRDERPPPRDDRRGGGGGRGRDIDPGDDIPF